MDLLEQRRYKLVKGNGSHTLTRRGPKVDGKKRKKQFIHIAPGEILKATPDEMGTGSLWRFEDLGTVSKKGRPPKSQTDKTGLNDSEQMKKAA